MRQGEPELSALYREHFDFVWRCLARHGVATADLEDAAQEVFLVVHRRLLEFESERACMRGWLYGIVKRVASNRRRSALRRQRFLVRFGQWRRGSMASESSLEPSLAARESLRMLDRCLAELEPGQRDAFILFEFEGMTGQEVAKALGIPQPTAFSRRRLARSRLREQLETCSTRSCELAQQPAPEAARTRVWALCLPCFSQVEATSSVSGPALAEPSVASGLWTPLSVGTAAVSVSIMVAAVAHGPQAEVETPARHSRNDASTDAAAPVEVGTAETLVAAVSDIAELPERQVRPLERTRAPGPAKSKRRPGGEPRVRRRQEQSATPGTGAGEGRLAAETRLVERARALLATGRAQASLAALDEHLRQFPKGFLYDAATLLRVEALQQLGQGAQAERVIEAFHRRRPGSALRSRFDALRGGPRGRR